MWLGHYLKDNRRLIDALRNIYCDITGSSGDSQNRDKFVNKPSVIRSGLPIWGYWDVESAYSRQCGTAYDLDMIPPLVTFTSFSRNLYHGGSWSCCMSRGPSQWHMAILVLPSPYIHSSNHPHLINCWGLHHAHRSHLWTHPHAQYIIMHVHRSGQCSSIVSCETENRSGVSAAAMIYFSVGGVAQWLGYRSVAGGLSSIYAWSMVDVWPLCG